MRIEIPGKPFAKQRPRMTRTGRTYTPAETVSFERTVGQYAMAENAEPITGPVKMRITAIFPMPKSWSQKKRLAMKGKPHTQRPDLDNCEKAILDGLNRIAFSDDSQVAMLHSRKVWGDEGKTIVEVQEAEIFVMGGGWS